MDTCVHVRLVLPGRIARVSFPISVRPVEKLPIYESRLVYIRNVFRPTTAECQTGCGLLKLQHLWSCHTHSAMIISSRWRVGRGSICVSVVRDMTVVMVAMVKNHYFSQFWVVQNFALTTF